MVDSIDIIMLASGFSRRFGKEDKLLHAFHGESLVNRALALACSIHITGEIIFVYANDKIGNAAEGHLVRPILNRNPERGLRESVRLGVAASSADYYLFLHCDQPFLDAATVDSILALRQPKYIIVPRHRGEPGNPALFSSFFRAELLTLGGGESPRLLKRRHPDRTVYVDILSSKVLRDIDTEEDWRLLDTMP